MGNLNIKLRKPIYGWGINDADYVTQPRHGDRCPYFDHWHSMLRRCYSENSMVRNSSYINKSVNGEWKYFTDFRSWMENQSWEGNALDKDILVYGNLEYSPENCIFVPSYVNSFFSSVSTKKTDLPLGVHIKYKLKTNPYVSQGAEDNKRTHLGCSRTPMEAHTLWQDWKLDSAYDRQAKYRKEGCFDPRVDVKFEIVIQNLVHQINNGLETTHIIY